MTQELNSIDIEKIISMLPHRYPFLLIDKVINIKKGESATGIKNVTVNEPHFQGHFPGKPVMPGVLILEAMAQTAAILVYETLGNCEGKLVYFTTIDKVKFRKPVMPGDQLHLNNKIIASKGNLWKVECVAEVDGKKVTEATISAMIME